MYDPNAPFFNDEDAEKLLDKPQKNVKKSKNILGMNAFQRFVISFLMMLVVGIMGTMVLLVLGKMQF